MFKTLLTQAAMLVIALGSANANATVATHEVQANVQNTIALNQDANYVRYIQGAKHGNVAFSLGNRQMVYKPNTNYYGADSSVVEFGKKHCIWFACWVGWHKVTYVFNVGPGYNMGLKNAAKNMKVGLAYNDKYNNFDLSKEPYKTIVREFGTITLENGHKWGSLSSAPGVYDFTNADKITRFANQNGIAVKGHTIFWHSQLPNYINSTSDKTVLEGYINQHVETMFSHYRCDVADQSLCIKDWDLINEIISDSPTANAPGPSDGRLRDSHLYRVLGSDFVSKLFIKARTISPSTVLWINDYGIESANKKADALYSVVKEQVENNVPIDGVGFQSHVLADVSPVELMHNMDRYRALGLQVNISELDVPAPPKVEYIKWIAGQILDGVKIEDINLIAIGALGRSEQEQQIYFENFAAACEMMTNCSWVTQWGLSDNESWMTPVARALTFKADLARKNTYFAMLKGLSGNGELRQPINDFFDFIFGFIF